MTKHKIRKSIFSKPHVYSPFPENFNLLGKTVGKWLSIKVKLLKCLFPQNSGVKRLNNFFTSQKRKKEKLEKMCAMGIF